MTKGQELLQELGKILIESFAGYTLIEDDKLCAVTVDNDLICDLPDDVQKALDGKWWDISREVVAKINKSSTIYRTISILTDADERHERGFRIENGMLYDNAALYDLRIPLSEASAKVYVPSSLLCADFTISMVSDNAVTIYTYDFKSNTTVVKSRVPVPTDLFDKRTEVTVDYSNEHSKYVYTYKTEGISIFKRLGLL